MRWGDLPSRAALRFSIVGGSWLRSGVASITGWIGEASTPDSSADGRRRSAEGVAKYSPCTGDAVKDMVDRWSLEAHRRRQTSTSRSLRAAASRHSVTDLFNEATSARKAWICFAGPSFSTGSNPAGIGKMSRARDVALLLLPLGWFAARAPSSFTFSSMFSRWAAWKRLRMRAVSCCLTANSRAASEWSFWSCSSSAWVVFRSSCTFRSSRVAASCLATASILV
mmetsp:Transcript_52471/g.139202  ORF Transcript_52471/g.139202 Transcript_52471/m.139202 type:complete len:225 (+) Transcript_52471:668-1342(+)